MPDFEARVVLGASLVAWLDPEGPGAEPSRINPQPGHPMKRYLGTVGVPVVIYCYVGGSQLPDGSLGGRLFVPYTVESPNPYPVSFTPTAGWTATVSFTPDTAGHYCVGIRRPEGGAVLVHVDAEDP